jgi:hypothetical protein
MKSLCESILDIEGNDKNIDKIVHLEYFNDILHKRAHLRTKEALDMFGRQIHVGDICLANIAGCERHFIQVKDFVDEGDGWLDIVPTVDYSYIDGRGWVHPSDCILIPKKQISNFTRFIKAK